MRKSRIVASCVALAWSILVAACAESQGAKSPSGNCGGPIYLDRRCEVLACGVCAPQMQACSVDESCNRIARCMLGCKHNVSETCGMLCVHGDQAIATDEKAATVGLGLYHDMLGCASRANIPECGPDS